MHMHAESADSFDDFSRTWTSDPDKHWKTALAEAQLHPLDDDPLNIGDGYYDDAKGSEKVDPYEDSGIKVTAQGFDFDLIPKRSCRRIDRAVQACPVYKRSFAKLSKQCRTLVESFVLWKKKNSKLPHNHEEARAWLNFRLICRASEISLRRDLRRVLVSIRSFRDQPATFYQKVKHDLHRRVLSNVMKLLLFPRPFFHYPPKFSLAMETVLDMELRFDMILLSWNGLRAERRARGQLDAHINSQGMSTPLHKGLVWARKQVRQEAYPIKSNYVCANTSDCEAPVLDIQPILASIKSRVESLVLCLQTNNAVAKEFFNLWELTKDQLVTEILRARTCIDQHLDTTSILRAANDLLILKVQLLEDALDVRPSSDESPTLLEEAPGTPVGSTFPVDGLAWEKEEAFFKIVYTSHFLQSGPSMSLEDSSSFLHCLAVALEEIRWFNEAADVIELQLPSHCAIYQKALSELDQDPDKFLSDYWCDGLVEEALWVTEETAKKYRALPEVPPTSNLAPTALLGQTKMSQGEGLRPRDDPKSSYEIAGSSQLFHQVYPSHVKPNSASETKTCPQDGLYGKAQILTPSGEIVEVDRSLSQGCEAPRQDTVALPTRPTPLCLTRLGRSDAELQAQWQLVCSLQKLTLDTPSEYGSHLAKALNKLSTQFRRIGCNHHALQASEEAVHVHRKLLNHQPEPRFAFSLMAFAFHLCDADRGDEALAASKEGVHLYRTLTRPFPGALQPSLASSLCFQSFCLCRLGHHQEALLAIDEAIALYQTMVNNGEEALEPSLAQALECRACCVALLRPVEQGMVRE